VGDKLSDLSAGLAAGLRRGTLVLTGHGTQEYADKAELVFAGWRAQGHFVVDVAANAAAAIERWRSTTTAATNGF
jgi:histidinol phosphatase-like enzyme